MGGSIVLAEGAPRPLRVLVSGQNDFAAQTLVSLHTRGHLVVKFLCTDLCDPDNNSASQMARSLSIEVVNVIGLDDEVASSVAQLNADIGVMAYVVMRAGARFLATPRYGHVHYHPSLLPRYRGPSAINWAIINGEPLTGFSIFRPNERLDDGEILMQQEVVIHPDDSAGSLYRRALLPQGVFALVRCMELVASQQIQPRRQDPSMASYHGWCRRQDARIDWSQSSSRIHNLVRGCEPKPGAWTTFGGAVVSVSKTINIPVDGSEDSARPGTILALGEDRVRVRCGVGSVEIIELRNAHNKRCPVHEPLLGESWIINSYFV